MRRKLTFISGVVFLAFVGLWVRSIYITDDVGFAFSDGSQVEAYTYPGRIKYVDDDSPLNPVAGWYHKSAPQWADGKTDFLGHDRGVRLAGFVFVSDPYSSNYHSFHAIIPLWFPILAAGLMPIAWILGLIRRRLPARKPRELKGPLARAVARLEDGARAGWRRAKSPRGLAAIFLILVFLGIGCFAWQTAHSSSGEWSVVTDPPAAPPEKMHGSVICVTCTRDGKLLAYGSDDKNVYLMDVARGKVQAVLRGHHDFVSCIRFSPDETILASSSNDGTNRLWDVATGTTLATFKDNPAGAGSLAFSNDGKILASGSYHMLRTWNLKSRTLIATFDADDSADSLQFTPDGKTIIVNGSDVKFRDASSGKVAAAFGGDRVSSIHCLAPGPGALLALADFGNDIEMWDAATQKQVATLKGHTEPVYSLAFSPDGKLLASGSDDRTIRIWNVATRQEIAKLTGRHNMAICFLRFSENGKRLLSASYDGIVERWDLR